MVTDLFLATVFSGLVSPLTSNVRAVPFSIDLDIPKTATSASGLLTMPQKVQDATMPATGYLLDYLPSRSGVKLRIANGSVIKFDKPQKVEGVLIYIEGTTNGVSDMIVSYSKVDSNTYYNLVMSGGSNGEIAIISV